MTKERHLGETIRQLREDRQLSIEALADNCRLSPSLIKQVEAGDTLPSLAPLMKIARGLGVRLGTFLDDEVYGGPVIVRGGKADEVVRFSGNEPSEQGALDFFSLASHKKDRHMEPFLVTVRPGTEHPPQLSSHEGEEFIYVLKGAVVVAFGKERYTLQAGDSIYYDSVVPHEVRAEGDMDAQLLAVVYAPF